MIFSSLFVYSLYANCVVMDNVFDIPILLASKITLLKIGIEIQFLFIQICNDKNLCRVQRSKCREKSEYLVPYIFFYQKRDYVKMYNKLDQVTEYCFGSIGNPKM